MRLAIAEHLAGIDSIGCFFQLKLHVINFLSW